VRHDRTDLAVLGQMAGLADRHVHLIPLGETLLGGGTLRGHGGGNEIHPVSDPLVIPGAPPILRGIAGEGVHDSRVMRIERFASLLRGARRTVLQTLDCERRFLLVDGLHCLNLLIFRSLALLLGSDSLGGRFDANLWGPYRLSDNVARLMPSACYERTLQPNGRI